VMRSTILRLIRRAGLVALFVAVAVAGAATGVLFAFTGDLPQISALDDYAPSTITRVYDRNGAVIAEYAVERRTVITYRDIPEHLRNAIVAAEDGNFFRHVGLSIPRMVLALTRDVVSRGRVPGGSTLTQQLTRNLFANDIGFTSGDTSWERKVKESLVAIQIEKRYTKEEIFTMYCNQIYWGHGAYGVQAAARLYFGKPASDLTLEESAMLAGIIQGNVRQSPYVNMEAALRRRNYALTRMADEGFITADQAEQSKQTPIVTRGEPNQSASMAPYFVEEVRRQLEGKYGAKALYESGLQVRTTLDASLQEAANKALDAGLRRIDKRRGWRAPARNVVAEGQQIDTFKLARWDRRIAAGDLIPVVVTGVSEEGIAVRAGRLRGAIPRSGYVWTSKAARQLVKPGDVIDARIDVLEDAQRFTAKLEQAPLVQGAVLAIENRTGRVLAMIGGASFDRSEFNRAVQAQRQVGSAFKPFVYAAAIDRGYTASSIIVDEPVSYPGGSAGAYQPMNYDREFHGPMTLRRALEQSRNIPAVKVMAELGPRQVAQYAKRMGVTSPIPPYLPVALGAAEASLIEMTSAYSVFPNQGVRMTPFLVQQVTDREGNLLQENHPEPHEGLRADTAYVMTNILRGVVQRGTAASAASLNWPIGGKTGTTDDYTDAWFIGFDPDITLGIWIGLDQKKSIGHGQTGTTAALPIWIEIMKPWIAARRASGATPDFARPGNIVLASEEAYIAGTQPGGIR
ncbi:MAG: PBP1A family penicillin-binding protein, partial [Acidobacteriota bacterium]|nr:PBP1A family penicillin-binding protein [Acidobacteriota bacterium]